MITEYVIASLKDKAETLAVSSVMKNTPVSAGQEEMNAFGGDQANRLLNLVDTTQHYLAIALLVATQALYHRRQISSSAHLGKFTEQLYEASVSHLRGAGLEMPYVDERPPMNQWIGSMYELLNRRQSPLRPLVKELQASVSK